MTPSRSTCFFLVSLIVVLISCRSNAVTISVSDACTQEETRSVRVEGFLRLPQTNGPVDNNADPGMFTLLLVEKDNGTGSFIKVNVPTTDSKERNRVDVMPLSYTNADMHVNTDSGKSVSVSDRLIVYGHVTKEQNTCSLRVEKIETP